MADAINILRRSVAAHVAQRVGLRAEQPTATQGNQRTRGNQSDIYSQPADADNWYPLQVLDVTDSNFGAFYFLPEYSTPGGPDIVL